MEDHKTLDNPIAIKRAEETSLRQMQEAIEELSKQTPSRQAEAQARAWLEKHGLYHRVLEGDRERTVLDLTQLLLCTQAAVLKEAAKEIERIRGNGSFSDFGQGVVAACIDMQTWLRQQAKERQP